MQTIPETLITTYLEMTDPAQFKPGFIDIPDVTIMIMQMPDLEFYRFLYRTVGEIWRWRDRLIMPDETLKIILESEDVDVYVLYYRGVPAGYVELERQARHSVGAQRAASLYTLVDVEIAYFGLRPEFIGRGLGKHLLSHGVQRAWESGASRVWLHTCNLDGPHALANYQARGFHIYEIKEEPMPPRYL